MTGTLKDWMNEDPRSATTPRRKLRKWDDPTAKCDFCGKRKDRHTALQARQCLDAMRRSA